MRLTNRMLRLTAIAIASLLALFTSGCHGFFTAPILQSITISPSSPTVAVGGTAQLTATGVNDDGSTSTLTNVTWSSSSASVATVSTTGLVTGVSNGTTTITATSGAISGTATVNVGNGNVASIAISPSNPFITSGQQQPFTATATLATGGTLNVTNTATWTSSNTLVAVISSNGVASAQTVTSLQQTTITATMGSVSGSTTLTVSP
jgi:trimeric autotransporter adhesin